MSDTFNVRGPNGKPIKVNPKRGKYRGKGRQTITRRHYFQGGIVNDIYFDSGYYFWPFWNATVVDDDGRAIQASESGSASVAPSDPTPAHHHTPAVDHSSHHIPASDHGSSHHSPSYSGGHDSGGGHSSSHDSGSGWGGGDSGSSGGSDGGGGGGGGD